jgi:hypothetical protein
MTKTCFDDELGDGVVDAAADVDAFAVPFGELDEVAGWQAAVTKTAAIGRISARRIEPISQIMAWQPEGWLKRQ